MQKSNDKKPIRKSQSQPRPGLQTRMTPEPVTAPQEAASGRLVGKVALISGGDSGIGKAVAILFAKEGADVAIMYLNEHEDAEDTRKQVEAFGKQCLLLPGDISKEKTSLGAVKKVVSKFGRIDILVNNAAIHYESKSLEEISTEQLTTTFATNIFSYFWLTKAALPHMGKGSSIINSTSVTAYRGSASLIDYASTKGAIVSFTRSLAHNVVEQGIRVNGVAPGPIWTPLIASSFDKKKVAKHGSDVPMKRAGEPAEVAPSYLFLASSDSSYMTGQILHPNGGEIVNG
ncbi:SDR family oxidoreductase [Aridibaculum aurantiacum]|uniref:SDR family oxidoreductase n=1 Tax=Aridibaculum aurantiacum TaxID=2810307 RepID=UPI001A959A01|nr:SDR family oxidoreductase [Aridibaculum aurantiacum]